ncbi:hypothetical protein B0H11DRAFT_1281238 [Mycena galericulata]|nr:hypothetical protein B0H11DRAFT_1281238 [Mycena galericulata]
MDLTRNACGAQKDITRLFPDELITEIVRNAARVDQATLCRVSKLFHSLSLPVLNCTVVLRTRNSEIPRAFCSALIANPGRADSIRSFTCLLRPLVYEDILLEAMKLMTGLERLSILKTPILSLLHFPCLTSCGVQILDSKVADKPIVSGFLTRHTTLTHVEMNSLEARPVAERIPLPNLRHYGGTALAIPEIHLSRLRSTRLNWPRTAGAPLIDEIILALNALTTPDRPFVSSHYCFTGAGESHLVILKSLATHMPHTTTLQMRFMHSELGKHRTNHGVPATISPTRLPRIGLCLQVSQPENSCTCRLRSDDSAEVRRRLSDFGSLQPSYQCMEEGKWGVAGIPEGGFPGLRWIGFPPIFIDVRQRRYHLTVSMRALRLASEPAPSN